MWAGKAVVSAIAGLAALALMATPAAANMLSESEGGFEDPWPSQPNPWVGDIVRNWLPGGAACGATYGGLETAGCCTQSAWLWLANTTVPPGTTLMLAGMVAGGTVWSAPTDLYIQLIDGTTVSDPLVDEWRLRLPGFVYIFDWEPFPAISGIINSGNVTINVGLWIEYGMSPGTGIHVDALNLTPEPCNMVLFLLAALPLLLRRGRARANG